MLFRKKYYALFVFLLISLTLGGVVAAQSGGPGTDDDPIVAKSYVDKYVKLQVVEVQAGQIIEAEAGTEIILRGGRATAVTSEAGGLADVTQGRDLSSGTVIPANHLLLIPRSDGRGLKAESDIILMVRGGYAIR